MRREEKSKVLPSILEEVLASGRTAADLNRCLGNCFDRFYDFKIWWLDS